MVEASEQKVLQKHLMKFLVSEVFNTIEESDVLSVETPEKWKYKNGFLTKGQITALRNQAIVFYKSDLWKILRDELRYKAQGLAMEKATTIDDIIASKMLTYLTDVIDTRLKRMIQDTK